MFSYIGQNNLLLDILLTIIYFFRDIFKKYKQKCITFTLRSLKTLNVLCRTQLYKKFHVNYIQNLFFNYKFCIIKLHFLSKLSPKFLSSYELSRKIKNTKQSNWVKTVYKKYFSRQTNLKLFQLITNYYKLVFKKTLPKILIMKF